MTMTPKMIEDKERMEKLTVELFPTIMRLNKEYGTLNLVGVLACFIVEMADQQEDPAGAIAEFKMMIDVIHKEDEDDDKKGSETCNQKP